MTPRDLSEAHRLQDCGLDMREHQLLATHLEFHLESLSLGIHHLLILIG